MDPGSPSAEAEAMLRGSVSSVSPASRIIIRVALYDSLTAPPRIEEVFGDTPPEIIERLSARAYRIARDAGGCIPYMVIRELAENLVHAGFADVVVSVLDSGRVVRFSDRGPGISDTERALRPGFSTATDEMRRYIKGVGSGLPIAAESMRFEGGAISIEPNLGGGIVVTASGPEASDPNAGRSLSAAVVTARRADTPAAMAPALSPVPDCESPGQLAGVPAPVPAPSAHRLTDRQKRTLLLVMEVGSIGPSGVSHELSVALSTAHRDLAFLQAEGYIRADEAGKRTLTPLGVSYIEGLF